MDPKLSQHREDLAVNPNAYEADFDRLSRSLIPHLRISGFSRIGCRAAEPLRRQFTELIFETQGRRPFYHIDSKLPFCWNARRDWRGGPFAKRIHYEWGHLRSKNQHPRKDAVENLGLMSPRCNQHIQSSMDVDEVLDWLKGSRVAERVELVLHRREALFATAAWQELKSNLGNFR